VSEPEDDLPTTRPLLSSPPPSPAMPTGQLAKLAAITGSFAEWANHSSTSPCASQTLGTVIDVLSAFIIECQTPPPLEELKKDLK